MVSEPHHTADPLVSHVASADQLTDVPRGLVLCDEILAVAAVLLMAGLIIQWFVRSRPVPLADAPPRPNRVREDALALAVAVYLTAGLAAQSILAWVTDQTEHPLSGMVTGNGASVGGLVACLAIGASRFPGGLRQFWLGQRVVRPLTCLGLVLALTVLALGLCPLVGEATIEGIRWVVPGYELPAHPTIIALHESIQPLGVVIALWIGAIVLAPVAEELFFRGLVQTWLVNVLGTRRAAIALSSVIFAAIHFGQPHAVAALFVLGALMGYAYERTGSLWPSVMIHAAFNAKTLVWDVLIRSGG